MNIDGCRVGVSGGTVGSDYAKSEQAGLGGKATIQEINAGRWPANLILDEEAGSALGAQARFFYCPKASVHDREEGLDDLPIASVQELVGREPGSAGANNPRAGAGGRGSPRRNIHPTVKPHELMRWLCRLVTPPGGRILDPFAGSGSTGKAAIAEGFDFVGCELSEAYAEIARRRCASAVASYPPGI